MREKMCDYPLVVKASDGRAVCPEIFAAQYKAKDNCQKCPKTRNVAKLKDGLLAGERAALRIIAKAKGY